MSRAAPKPKAPSRSQEIGAGYNFDYEPEEEAAERWPPQEAVAKARASARVLSKLPPPTAPLALHTPWATPLRGLAQSDLRPDGPTQVGAKARGHRPAVVHDTAEIGFEDLGAVKAFEAQGYRPVELDQLSEASSQDSTESLSGEVRSRWDPGKRERRFAYGRDASVQFSRTMRPLEWDSSDWVEQLKKENHLGGRLPGERLKAAVAKVIAFNRSQKFIANPDAETLKEVHAARDAEQERENARNLEKLQREKDRLRELKLKAKDQRREKRAREREEQHARIEKELLKQNTEAQLLVDSMRYALLQVPALQPPVVPDLHAAELIQAQELIHEFASSDLGKRVSEMHSPQPVREAPTMPQNGQVKHWDRQALNEWMLQARSFAEASPLVTPAVQKPPSRQWSFYPPAQDGLLLERVAAVTDVSSISKQPWYPGSEASADPSRADEAEPEPEGTGRIWL
eukprot:TRINITY_DN66074_c0_g1_i1.p1 TRINITY_DN66074_c0_g1~~TRINITY_DN66074_c0_g1_i1.p1  ORF type:complete len:467 (+),score=113.39 TRINITY_DN66074_c0_g1_i1:32-1402(+)